jgi:hypothetical protein
MLTKYALIRHVAERPWSLTRPDCVVSAVLSRLDHLTNGELGRQERGGSDFAEGINH